MMKKRRHIKGRAFVMALSVMIIAGSAFNTSLAWFTDSTSMVKNVFTVGDIDLQFLAETGSQTADMSLDEFSENNIENPTIVPGKPIPLEDTTLVVSAESETCYLFAKIDTSIGGLPSTAQVEGEEREMTFEDYFHYTVADGWIAGDGISVEEGGNGLPTNVYYRIVEQDSAEKSFKIIGNDEIVPSSEITKDMLTSILIKEDPDLYPALSLSAYAVQYIGGYSTPFTPAEAWAIMVATGE